MMGRKQKIICADEWDVLYGRKIYCYLQNCPKHIKEAKKRMNKRFRKEQKYIVDNEIKMLEA